MLIFGQYILLLRIWHSLVRLNRDHDVNIINCSEYDKHSLIKWWCLLWVEKSEWAVLFVFGGCICNQQCYTCRPNCSTYPYQNRRCGHKPIVLNWTTLFLWRIATNKRENLFNLRSNINCQLFSLLPTERQKHETRETCDVPTLKSWITLHTPPAVPHFSLSCSSNTLVSRSILISLFWKSLAYYSKVKYVSTEKLDQNA